MRYLCGSVAFAQPSNSATFMIPHVTADNNTEVCIPVMVDNFSSGVEFSFAIQWDPPTNGGALTLSTINPIRNLNPSITNFEVEDFNLVDYVDIGLITVEWGNYPNGGTCDGVTPITIPDGSIMFEVCFDVSGAGHSGRRRYLPARRYVLR